MRNHIPGNYKCLVHKVGFATEDKLRNHAITMDCRASVKVGEIYTISRYKFKPLPKYIKSDKPHF